MEKLTKKEVEHVANLAKLNVGDSNIEMYQEQLSGIMSEIDKITELEIDADARVMVSPSENINTYEKLLEENNMLKKNVLKNASSKDEDYIKVVKVIND